LRPAYLAGRSVWAWNLLETRAMTVGVSE
jgi:hypothetical protein